MSKHEVMERIEPAPPVPASESSAIISMIERAARDPSVDIDKFERLMAMKERVEQEAAKRAFHDAMASAQAKIPQIVRDAENSHTKSKYARLETIAKKVTPIITEHGFFTSFNTADSPLPGHYRLVCQLGHRDGYSREYHADLPSDAAGSQGKANKTAIQAFGSTISYGRRYLTMMIFNVAIANEDNDGNAVREREDELGHETLSFDQAKELHALLTKHGRNLDRFLRHYKIEALPDLPAARFAEAKKAIEDAVKATAQKGMN